jgi:hypothetical protein
MKLTFVILIALAAVNTADAGCRGRRCKPAAQSCQPCQPMANAITATANVIAAPVRVITGGCAGGVCR